MLERLYQGFLERVNRGGLPPRLQKFLWKRLYQVLARNKDGAWTCMNYGWMPAAGETPIPLDSADEPNRWFLGLYYRLAMEMDLAGKQVLEVGSGRGGGSSWLARTYAPGAMVGLDYSPAAVALSRDLHAAVPNLSFVEGDAEHLPFPDASFDAVINVESSHCYGNMPRFVAEVARVLKPGGRFGWVDLRGPGMLEATEAAFGHPDLQVIAAERINEGVVRALDAAHDSKMDLIATMRVGKTGLRQFAGVRGSLIYKLIKNGTAPYLLKILIRS